MPRKVRKPETQYVVRNKRTGEEHTISPRLYTKVKHLTRTFEFIKVREGESK